MNKLRNLIMGIAAVFAGGALAIPAAADVTVGGFMNQRIGFGDYRVNSGGDSVKSDESLHFRTDAEVLFTATGTTEGGLKVTARVELEGDSGGDQIDENWLSVEGDFGKVTLGGEDAAVITHGYVGIGSGFGNIGTYDSGDTWTPVGAEMYPVGYGDYQGVRYSTPNFGGFSGAISFQPESKDAGGSQTSTDNDHSLISVAGSYSTNMGAMSLTVGGGFLSRGDNPDNKLTGTDGTSGQKGFVDFADDNKLGVQWGAGAEIGFGSNTIFLRTDFREDQNGTGDDQRDWAIQYERSIGKTTFALGYAKRTDDGVDPKYTSKVAGGRDVKYSKYVAGANYALGGGTTVGAAVAWGEIDNPTGPDPDGTSFGAHIAFSF